MIHRRLRLAHLGLRNVELRARRIVGRLRHVQFALRYKFALLELFGALQSSLSVFHGNFRLRGAGLRGEQIGASLFDACGEFRLIELRDHLLLGDFGVVVGAELGDGAGDLAADKNRRHRLQCPGRGNHLADIAFAHRHREIGNFFRTIAHAPVGIAGAAGRQHQYDNQQSFFELHDSSQSRRKTFTAKSFESRWVMRR